MIVIDGFWSDDDSMLRNMVQYQTDDLMNVSQYASLISESNFK